MKNKLTLPFLAALIASVILAGASIYWRERSRTANEEMVEADRLSEDLKACELRWIGAVHTCVDDGLLNEGAMREFRNAMEENNRRLHEGAPKENP